MSTEEENKATFRRYAEEITNRGNFDLADEIFDRYIARPTTPSVRCLASLGCRI